LVRGVHRIPLLEFAMYGGLSFMPDDPKKKGAADRKRVSQQPHEQRYQALVC
jgi:hypothetical protein